MKNVVTYVLSGLFVLTSIPVVVFATSGLLDDMRQNVDYRTAMASSYIADRQAALDELRKASYENEHALDLDGGDDDTSQSIATPAEPDTDVTDPVEAEPEDVPAPPQGADEDVYPSDAAQIKSDYVIQPGDTLSYISKMSQVPVDMIADYNDIQNVNLIHSGASLSFPEKKDTDEVYFIQAGDTLTRISQEWDMSIADIAEYNKVRNVNLIYADTVLWKQAV